MKVYFITLCIILLGLFGTKNIAQQVYTVEELAARAIFVSPKLKMMENELKAAESRIASGSNLPDPMIMIGVANLPVTTFSFAQEPMTGKMISVSQGIPFPGKLISIETVASVDTAITSAGIDEEKNNIRKEVISIAYNYLYLQKALDITIAKKELVKNITEIVRTKYEVSNAHQQNLLSIELELSNIDEKIIQLNSELVSSQKILQAFLLTNNEISIDINPLETFEQTNIQQDSDELEKLADEKRPLFKQLRLSGIKAERMVEVTDYQYYPDFNLALQYMQRDKISSMGSQSDLLSFSVGFNLPINYGGNKTAKIDEAKMYLDYQLNNIRYNTQNLRIQLASLLAKIKSQVEREKLINKKLIQANQTFNSSIAEYQVGTIDFINVINDLNNLLDIEIELYDIRKNFYQTKAELSFLVGQEL